MFTIGCHISSSGGFEKMGRDALSIGANTFQFFTRNPRGSKAKAIDEADVAKLITLAEENDFGVLLAHAPYTLNPCSAKEEVRAFAKMVMEDDLKRMEYLPNSYYNFHPGSHTGLGAEKGIVLITELINDLLEEDHTTTLLLETMSGKGTEVGRSFEEIAAIIQGVDRKGKVGVCLGTCHVHEAGYDIIDDLEGVLQEFDAIIGLEKLKAIHLNDSKNERGARKDRHEVIGEGTLGLDTVETIINHPKLRDLPFYLETPNELEGHGQEIALLKSLRK